MSIFTAQSMPAYPRPGQVVVDTTARWLTDDEDCVLGCESANPALQIERWGHETQQAALDPC